MSKIIGRLNNLGIGKESVRGTAVSAAIWVPQLELSYDDRVKTVVNEASVGRLEGSDSELVTGKYGEVTMKSKVKDKSIGYILYSLFGGISSAAKSAPNTAVYDHTFSVGQTTQHQSLTLALKGPNDDVAMPNAVIDSLKLTAEVGNYLMYEAHALGKASASASNTASYTAENDFIAKHITFKKATTQAGLAGASATVIRGFELEIKANAVLEEVLGNVAPNDVLNQSFSISGSVTLVHDGATFHDLMTGGTYNAFRFDVQNTDVTIGTSSNPGLQIDLHRCIISNYERKMTVNELVEETFDFKAHYSLTDSKMVTAILTNLQTSY